MDRSRPGVSETSREVKVSFEVIGHMKIEGHLGRCHLKGRDGDAANVILTAVGRNLCRVLAWLRAPLRLIMLALWRAFAAPPEFIWAS